MGVKENGDEERDDREDWEVSTRDSTEVLDCFFKVCLIALFSLEGNTLFLSVMLFKFTYLLT